MNLEKYSAVQWLTFGQLCLAVGIAICFVIRPHFAFSGGGISNYGVITLTIPFFTIAFLGATLGTLLAAQRLTRSAALRRALHILASLFLLTLLSTYTYKLNTFFDTAHQDVSMILGVWEVAFSIWLIIKTPHDTWGVVSFLGQVCAAIITILTILGFVHILFLGEILSGATFGVLLIRKVGDLSNPIQQIAN